MVEECCRDIIGRIQMWYRTNYPYNVEKRIGKIVAMRLNINREIAPTM
jgi:hypothetical protein